MFFGRGNPRAALNLSVSQVAEEVVVDVESEHEVDFAQVERVLRSALGGKEVRPGLKIKVGPLDIKVVDVKPPQAAKFDPVRTKITKNGTKDQDACTISFEDIEGYDEYKKIAKLQIERLRRREKPRSIFITGPAGTGKTTFVYACIAEAKRHGINVFELNGSVFDREGLFGVSARNVREIFEEAKKHQPAIIVIDELEQFGLRRDEGRDDEGIRVLDEILKGIDEIEHKNLAIMVIAVTNTPKILDKALIRKGRFDYVFKMNGLPNSALANLLRKELEKEGVKLDANIESLDLNKLTPAEVVALARRLADKAILHNKEKIDLNFIQKEIEEILEERKILEENYV